MKVFKKTYIENFRLEYSNKRYITSKFEVLFAQLQDMRSLVATSSSRRTLQITSSCCVSRILEAISAYVPFERLFQGHSFNFNPLSAKKSSGIDRGGGILNILYKGGFIPNYPKSP